MKITPQEIHHKEFKTTMRGYNVEEVDIFLDEVADAMERLTKENYELRESIEHFKERLQKFEDMSGALQETLITAQRTADEMRAKAADDAKRTLEEARVAASQQLTDSAQEAKRLEADLARLHELYLNFKKEIKRAIIRSADAIDQAEPAIVSEVAALSSEVSAEATNVPPAEEISAPDAEAEQASTPVEATMAISMADTAIEPSVAEPVAAAPSIPEPMISEPVSYGQPAAAAETPISEPVMEPEMPASPTPTWRTSSDLESTPRVETPLAPENTPQLSDTAEIPMSNPFYQQPASHAHAPDETSPIFSHQISSEHLDRTIEAERISSTRFGQSDTFSSNYSVSPESISPNGESRPQDPATESSVQAEESSARPDEPAPEDPFRTNDERDRSFGDRFRDPYR